MGRALDSLVPGFGGALGGGVHALSVWTPAERVIGADTAAWSQVIQGHSQDRRHGNPPVGQETRSSGASFAAGRKARSQYEKPAPAKADAGVPS